MPTPTDLSLDTVQLSNLSIAVSNELSGFIAETVFPVIKVEKKDGNHYVFDSTHLRIDNAERAAGARSNRIDYGLTTAAYGPLVEYSYEMPLDDFVAQQSPIDLATAATKALTEKMMIYKEKKLATLLSSTSVVTQYATIGTKWSTYATSVPFSNIQTAVSVVTKASGRRPNTLFMGQAVWDQLVNHPDLVERVKYTYGNTSNKMSITPDELGSILGMKVFVGSGIYETADEGATSSKDFIWGKNAWVAYVAPTPGLMTETAGYHFQLNEPRKIDSYRDNSLRSTVYRISDYFNPKLVSVAAIYLMDAAVA